MVDILTAYISRDGGTGRRTGFKIPRWQQRESSILSLGTKKYKNLIMIEHKLIKPETHEIIVRPNPAMSWSLIKKIYLCFVILILIIAIVLSYINLYLAIPFYGVETIFLGYALYITALKSTFFEKITIGPTDIEISFVQGKKKSNVKFVKEWSKFYFIPPTNLKHSEIYISRSGTKTFVGSKINDEDRKKLFNLLKTL